MRKVSVWGMIQLREYQRRLIDDVAYEFQSRDRVCLVAPCGAGKTITVGWMAQASALKGSRTLFLVHRQELIRQSIDTFDAMNIRHGVIATRFAEDDEPLVQVGSVQTVARRLGRITPPDFIVIDEAHHATAGTWKRVIAEFPYAKVLGVTATPERLGGHGLGDIFQSLVIGPTVRELIDWGNLAPYDYYAPPNAFDADQVSVRFGEYVKADLEKQVDKNTVVGNIIDNYKQLADGMRAVCYCVSLAHSKHVADSFCRAGIPAMHIDGQTPEVLRMQAVQDFRDDKIKVLCNVDLISEGFDVPAMEAVLLARPTQSLTLYIQQAMRAMRPDRNNPQKRAVIVDHVGNVFRHGLPDEDRLWSLESKRRRSAPRAVGVKVCERCFKAFWSASVCPYCGYAPPRAEREQMPKEADGKLLKIEDVERKARRQEVGRARSIEELEQIAINRGYSMRWVTHIARAKGIRGCGRC